ncbi:MAG: hypothetical protein NC930_02710, partial [Candidatus Omnitrophica bacterium]|nr:hypothetical protein [Candidatus Omnitrophota bacterium]
QAVPADSEYFRIQKERARQAFRQLPVEVQNSLPALSFSDAEKFAAFYQFAIRGLASGDYRLLANFAARENPRALTYTAIRHALVSENSPAALALLFGLYKNLENLPPLDQIPLCEFIESIMDYSEMHFSPQLLLQGIEELRRSAPFLISRPNGGQARDGLPDRPLDGPSRSEMRLNPFDSGTLVHDSPFKYRSMRGEFGHQPNSQYGPSQPVRAEVRPDEGERSEKMAEIAKSVKTIFRDYNPSLVFPMQTVLALSGSLFGFLLPVPVVTVLPVPDYRNLLFQMGLAGEPRVGVLPDNLMKKLGIPASENRRSQFGVTFIPFTIRDENGKKSIRELESLVRSLLTVWREYPNKVGAIVVEGRITETRLREMNVLSGRVFGSKQSRLIILRAEEGGYSQTLGRFFQGNWKGANHDAFRNLYRVMSPLARKAGVSRLSLPKLMQHASVVGREDEILSAQDHLSNLKWQLLEKEGACVLNQGIQADRLMALSVLALMVAGEASGSDLEPELLKAEMILNNLDTQIQPGHNILAWLKADAGILDAITELREASAAFFRSA